MQLVRDFEDVYNGAVNSSTVVSDAITARNEGWDTFRSGAWNTGLGMITDSVRLLGSVEDLGFDRGLAFTPHIPGFKREAYASVARLAQAQCAAGIFDDAAETADLARRLTPDLVYLDGGGTDTEVLGNLVDQYEVIFSGRLALVLSAVKGGSKSFYTIHMVERAKKIAVISEDHRKVVFSNREFTEEERCATATKFSKVASIAGMNQRIPILAGRQAVARWACSK
jgi:hypothetical protein